MRTALGCILAFGLQGTLLAAGPRLTFTRTIAPAIDLGAAEQLAVTYAIGDTEQINTFVGWFVEYAGKNGTLRIEDAVDANQNAGVGGEAKLRKLRREHPADAYISVRQFTCSGGEHSAEGGERDTTGERVRRRHTWVDATCRVRLEIHRPNGKLLLSYEALGEGTSPRAVSLTAEERQIAFQQAARYAAFNAAEMIVPRVVRESIELDESAPRFADGWGMVDAERLRDARAIWETALRLHRDSAALHYDLGAVCQALGDLGSARQYLQTAVRLSPGNRLYRDELAAFEHRLARP